ncbi:MAG: DUF2314 domain-containing protein [Verrucomicrobia bacterium]|nr:DUF2314 domain-containing protein [Verrucomicrobiota bacterium]
MSEPIFMFDANDPQMQQAYRSAQDTFRYFWRELAWERRRIVPGLDMAMVKLPFTDGPRTDGKSEYEHMWVGDIGFDGDSVSGTLLNAPNWLTSVRKGDAVSVPFSHITDWMMTADGRAYGGHTVNLMRARMDRSARSQHDQAWGLDFGDPADIQIEIQRQPKAKKGLLASLFGKSAPKEILTFCDHPMCVNMLPKVEAQLKADPGIARSIDDQGWSLLHHEALAGNLGITTLLLRYGADPSARTPSGYTAGDLARKIGWLELAESIR